MRSPAVVNKSPQFPLGHGSLTVPALYQQSRLQLCLAFVSQIVENCFDLGVFYTNWGKSLILMEKVVALLELLRN